MWILKQKYESLTYLSKVLGELLSFSDLSFPISSAGVNICPVVLLLELDNIKRGQYVYCMCRFLLDFIIILSNLFLKSEQVSKD